MNYYNSRVESWGDLVNALDGLDLDSWVFRGHQRAEWALETTLEREFRQRAPEVEQQLLWRFVRTAPRLLPSHLVPHENDAAAWLGLIQHYGGPTRLLDVTRSPYVALFFAFERDGAQDRAIWIINHLWCADQCARIMSKAEDKPLRDMHGRTLAAQAQLVYCLVHRQPFPDPLFSSFRPFSGVFPVDPWKPDVRQIAQQALFLCPANLSLGFIDNLASHPPDSDRTVLHRVVMAAAMRAEVLERLSLMNVTAATLLPDLTGLARSLLTYPVRRPIPQEPKP